VLSDLQDSVVFVVELNLILQLDSVAKGIFDGHPVGDLQLEIILVEYDGFGPEGQVVLVLAVGVVAGLTLYLNLKSL